MSRAVYITMQQRLIEAMPDYIDIKLDRTKHLGLDFLLCLSYKHVRLAVSLSEDSVDQAPIFRVVSSLPYFDEATVSPMFFPDFIDRALFALTRPELETMIQSDYGFKYIRTPDYVSQKPAYDKRYIRNVTDRLTASIMLHNKGEHVAQVYELDRLSKSSMTGTKRDIWFAGKFKTVQELEAIFEKMAEVCKPDYRRPSPTFHYNELRFNGWNDDAF